MPCKGHTSRINTQIANDAATITVVTVTNPATIIASKALAKMNDPLLEILKVV